nr:MBL fold metallo-hydrolase [Sphingomonas bacterium]
MPGNRYYHGPESDHFDGLRFFNPGQPTTDRSLFDLLRWRLSAPRSDWPKSVAVRRVKPDARVDRLRITMVGHATVLIQVAGINLLSDPVWSDRTSPFAAFGPERVTVPGIAFDDLPPIDVVLVSHNHYDHLDLMTLGRLHAAHAPLMVMPLGNDTIIRAAVHDARIAVGDWHDQIEIAPGVATTLTPATHWSARGIRDRRMALWAGHYLKTSRNGSVWFAGDTGYGDGAIFRDLRHRHGAPDVALLAIGAYAPRWFMAPQHTDPAEAVRIFADVGARHALGIHWGTFPLSDEPREEPPALLAAALAQSGVEPSRFPAAEPGSVYHYASESAAKEPCEDKRIRPK